IDAVVEGLDEEFDSVHGGFSNAARKFRGPKFPMPPVLVLLQHEAKRAKARELAGMVETTLDRVALGGMYGHGGGGVARASVVPLSAPLEKLASELKTPEESLEQRLAGMRQKLFDIREKRLRPFLDTKVLTAWNGQMIAGLARAGEALGDKKAIEAAIRAARF